MIFGDRKISFKFKPSIQESLWLAGAFNLADFIPFLGAFDPQGMTHRWKHVRKIMDQCLEKIINEYEQNTIEQQDCLGGFTNVLLSLMKADSNTQELKLDRSQVKAITLEILAAAMDTSASTVEWALSELLRHPRAMKNFKKKEADLEKLDYLNMVVKETMRLHPVTAIYLRESTDDIAINNFHIPKKTWIMINNWAISRDPVAWAEKTEEFYPERFINANLDVRGQDMKLLPFGSGRRKCAGMELGIKTVQLVLAQVLHCFTLELPDGMSPRDVNMKDIFGLTVPRADHLLVVPNYLLHITNI
ncbi:hypothetical protein AQUCO_00201134v1 [Aquilegia coerulea]|uniref:Cytochrome P450 n=1 Tax=Aquilegia coerulea TaxID=218851 RepID=A0A2G5F6C4_AQUCA|nr:hypothetical protein AQUCO_00201134v1 [Aquilegia coerulea]